MIINARFAGKCPGCHGDIAVGERVDWARGRKAYHVRCAGALVRTAARRAANGDLWQHRLNRRGQVVGGDRLDVQDDVFAARLRETGEQEGRRPLGNGDWTR